MTRDQINKWLKRYGVIVFLCLALLAVWSLPIAVGENKFYIQTEEPEDNFVVVCRWSFPFLSTSRVLIGKSNTDIDCGRSYGVFSVEIMHPLYRTMRGSNHPYSSERYRYEDDKMIFKSFPFDQFLTSIQKKYQSEKYFDRAKLVNEASWAIKKHFAIYYFYYYAQAREPDIEYLKSLYNDRLIKFLQPMYSSFDFGKRRGSPESIVKQYWELWGEYNAEI